MKLFSNWINSNKNILALKVPLSKICRWMDACWLFGWQADWYCKWSSQPQKYRKIVTTNIFISLLTNTIQSESVKQPTKEPAVYSWVLLNGFLSIFFRLVVFYFKSFVCKVSRKEEQKIKKNVVVRWLKTFQFFASYKDYMRLYLVFSVFMYEEYLVIERRKEVEI